MMIGVVNTLALIALGAAATAAPAADPLPPSEEGRAAPPAGVQAEVETPAQSDTSPARTSGRLDLTHTFSVDDQAPRNLSYSELRGGFDGGELFGVDGLELHFDGRGRYSWNSLRDHRVRITDMYLQYGGSGDTWRLAAGRQNIATVPGAEVDGLRFGFRLGERSSLSAFAGLIPNPITGDPQVDFIGGGLEYEAHSETLNHAGGAMVQTFKGDLERFFLSERFYARLGENWYFFGLIVVDLFAARGLLGDLNKTATANQSFGERLDLSRANLNLKYRPTPWLDIALNASHHHTILPNAWWQSYLALLQAQRGFSIDGPEQVGTRITSLRLTSNVRLPAGLTPYLRLRWDRRHTQVRDGGEFRVGIKWRRRAFWADAGYTFRHHFRVESNLVRLFVGTTFSRTVGGEAGAIVMQSSPHAEVTSQVVVDLHAHLWWEIGEVFTSLDGVRLFVQYQGYIQEAAMLHLLVGQIGYRFDTGR